jgi:hypothetical protein
LLDNTGAYSAQFASNCSLVVGLNTTSSLNCTSAPTYVSYSNQSLTSNADLFVATSGSQSGFNASGNFYYGQDWLIAGQNNTQKTITDQSFVLIDQI